MPDPSKPSQDGDASLNRAPARDRRPGERIDPARLKAAKRAFVTRRADILQSQYLLGPEAQPQAGDLLLARVVALGQHRRLELVSGRRAHLFVGDEIVVAYGERYASDQFHSVLPPDLSECDLVAAGGIASQVIEKNARIKKATRIAPIGLLSDETGRPLNLAQAALPAPGPASQTRPRPQIIAVVGSSMNAGKTTTAANIAHCLNKANIRVAACKATGTGAGGDVWRLLDAGASPVLDFTDAGLASTYNASIEDMEKVLKTLLAHIAESNAQVVILEIADGLFQTETRKLLQHDYFRRLIDHIVFAAADALSASAGVQTLSSWGYSPSAISGSLVSSPLSVKETEEVTSLPVVTNEQFQFDEAILTTLLQPAHLDAAIK